MPTIISGSTGISGTDGTAATPAVQGTDTNTGMFFPAADTIAFAEGGTEVMRIDSSGNVGIGTASPVGRLTVAGGRTLVGPASEVYALGIGFNVTRVNSGQVFYLGASDSTTPDLLLCNAGGLARLSVSDSGVLSFNSGFGSVFAAYGCRAWVNFNGTGVVAIRASGNITSITDNNTGDYTVNFTNAMPDINYSAVSTASGENGARSSITDTVGANGAASPRTTTTLRVLAIDPNIAMRDAVFVNVAVFR